MTMYGSIVAFKDFSPGKGFGGSPWVGFKHFISFFNNFLALSLDFSFVIVTITVVKLVL